MAFRLKRRRAIGNELSRIVRREFEKALDQLQRARTDPEGIHETRKAVKKIRSELRLLHDALGPVYSTRNKQLRHVAHLLSTLRDADATVETFRDLRHQYHRVVTPAVGRSVARGLASRKRRVIQNAPARVSGAAATLQRLKRRVEREVREAGRVPTVRHGLVRGYRRARGAMKGLSLECDASQFHLWRRRLKDHWYHVRLFEGLHRTARARAGTLRRLEKWLGDDHNLAALRSVLVNSGHDFGSARNTALVLGCIVKHQVVLRGQALRLGHRLFAPKPADFRHSTAPWW